MATIRRDLFAVKVYYAEFGDWSYDLITDNRKRAIAELRQVRFRPAKLVHPSSRIADCYFAHNPR